MMKALMMKALTIDEWVTGPDCYAMFIEDGVLGRLDSLVKLASAERPMDFTLDELVVVDTVGKFYKFDEPLDELNWLTDGQIERMTNGSVICVDIPNPFNLPPLDPEFVTCVERIHAKPNGRIYFTASIEATDIYLTSVPTEVETLKEAILHEQ